jgi:hypothetical protein
VGWTTDESVFDSAEGHKMLSLGCSQLSIQWVTGALSAGGRVAGTAGCSPPSTYEVESAYRYTSTPLYAHIKWCLIKYQDNLLILCGRLCTEVSPTFWCLFAWYSIGVYIL